MLWSEVVQLIGSISQYVLSENKAAEEAAQRSKALTDVTDNIIEAMQVSLRAEFAAAQIREGKNRLQDASEKLTLHPPDLDGAIADCISAQSFLDDPETELGGLPFFVDATNLRITALELNGQALDARLAARAAERHLRSVRGATAISVGARFSEIARGSTSGISWSYALDGERQIDWTSRANAAAARELHREELTLEIQKPFCRAGSFFSLYSYQYKRHARFALRAANGRYLNMAVPDNPIWATGTSPDPPANQFVCYKRVYDGEPRGALLCTNGLFLSVLSGGSICGRIETIADRSTFALVVPEPGTIAFKSRATNRFLNIQQTDGDPAWVLECRDSIVGPDSTFRVIAP